MTLREWASGLVMLGSWFLVQVPAKDMRLTNPGSNMPPITQFKKVREFPSAAECQTFRDSVLKDSAMVGSDAMLDQASSLRCVSAEQLAPPATTAPPATP
jgi:hypothetical protein